MSSQREDEMLPDFSLMIAAVDLYRWSITKEATAQDKPARWTVKQGGVVYAESHTMRKAVAEAMKRKEKENA